MRGKEVRALGETLEKGITPAYAGKSTTALQKRFIQKDHPRLCGEKQLFNLLLRVILGSPPPMRGKENWANDPQMLRRITPAYAGKRDVKPPIIRLA